MIKIDFNGKEYELRNTISEITIEEFECIMLILSKENENIFTKWMEIVSIIGLDQDVIDNIDVDSFLELTTQFEFNKIDGEIQKEIEIDGVIYSCYSGDTFKLKMKDLKKIEDIIKKNVYYFSTLCAFLYTRKDFSETENLEKEHILYKKEFFKNQKVELLIPILNVINESLIKKVNLLINGNN
jgi:hypothetical protein